MTTLFVSDLHLESARPEITSQFLGFLAEEGDAASAIYILGDLFEAWLGDDTHEPEHRRVMDALKHVSNNGTALYFLHGNRDFLIGEHFAAQTGCHLLDDPTLVELYGTQLLLMHGDTLCIDDVDYQSFRRTVRDPVWQANFLGLPLSQRAVLAEEVKAQTRAAVQEKASEIMDVNQGAVEAVMRDHGVALLLHGHTHRPAVHEFTLDGAAATRIVLGDWYEQGSVVRWDEAGFRLEFMPR